MTEDEVDRMITKLGPPEEIVQHEGIRSSYGRVTFWQWCELELVRIPQAHPLARIVEDNGQIGIIRI